MPPKKTHRRQHSACNTPGATNGGPQKYCAFFESGRSAVAKAMAGQGGKNNEAVRLFSREKKFSPFPRIISLKTLLFSCEVAVAEGVVHFKVGCEFGFDISVEEQCGVHSFSRGGVVDDF